MNAFRCSVVGWMNNTLEIVPEAIESNNQFGTHRPNSTGSDDIKKIPTSLRNREPDASV